MAQKRVVESTVSLGIINVVIHFRFFPESAMNGSIYVKEIWCLCIAYTHLLVIDSDLLWGTHSLCTMPARFVSYLLRMAFLALSSVHLGKRVRLRANISVNAAEREG